MLINNIDSVNVVVPRTEVVPVAIRLAKQIVENSPDAVQSTKRGLLLAQKHNFEESVLKHVWAPETSRTFNGANIKVRPSLQRRQIQLDCLFQEGLMAFAQVLDTTHITLCLIHASTETYTCLDQPAKAVIPQ
jgi:hypothetical protein